jgi:hypothetical protein
MQVAVANRDFPVSLVSDDGKAIQSYQVANGEDLKLLSGRMKGVVASGGHAYNGTRVMAGYLVEIEGQTMFIDEGLLEVSQ